MPTNVLMNLLEEVGGRWQLGGDTVMYRSVGCGTREEWFWSLACSQRGRKATRLAEGLSWMEKQFRERLGGLCSRLSGREVHRS